MSMRGTRRFAIAFFVVYVIAVTWPGVMLFRGPEPFLFGMPLALVWTAAWIVASFFVLIRLDQVYGRAERAHDAHATTSGERTVSRERDDAPQPPRGLPRSDMER